MTKQSRSSFHHWFLGPAILAALSAWIAAPGGQQQPTPLAPAYVSGEILVKFRDTAPTPRRNAVLASEGARLLRRFDQLDLHRIAIRQGESVERAVADFSARADVMFAQPNYVRHVDATGPPNDPYWLNNTLWGLQRIMAQPAWNNFPTGGPTVVVADIDTGVNYNHPDLIANMWHNPGETPGNHIDDDGDGFIDDVYGIDTVNNDSDPMDDHGHGTHTSGTIGGVGNNGTGVVGVVGATLDVKILACKFLDADGSGSDSDAVACFNYIVMLKNRGINIRVSSNSWGGARGSGSPATVLKNAIDAAGNAGILNAIAAGNDGVNNDLIPHDPAAFTSPSIVSVAASDGQDNVAGFSNYGVVSTDLAAPGVGIMSTTGNSYQSWSGTSMATPHVAGAAAFIASQRPSLSVAEIKTVLMGNVDHLGQWTGKVASGGRLNLFTSAVAAFGTNTAPTVSLTAPAGGTYTALATVPLTATAGDIDGSVSKVDFYTNGNLIGTDSTSPYSFTWTNVAAGTYTLTARATDNLGATTTSAGVSVTVTVPPVATAIFRGLDTTTQGTWRGVYGSQGYGLVSDTSSFPSYAQVAVAGVTPTTWTSSTSDPRALQRASGTDRVAACVGSATSFTIDVNFTDGLAHQLALYVLDWDTTARTQRVEVLNAAGGAVLDTRTVAGFQGGQYLVWTLSGHVTVRVTSTGGPTAVVSGLFIDAPPAATAFFRGSDTNTQGNWRGVYGTQGAGIVYDSGSFPAYAQVTTAGTSLLSWTNSSSDRRAMQRAVGTGHVAGCLCSATSFTIDVNLTDGLTHQVSLYVLDWDTTTRSQRIDVLNAVGGAVLDTRSVAAFQAGQYLTWTVSGHVVLRVTNTGVPTAVVSGVFLDPAP